MEFNIKDLKELVEKINKPSVIIYCSSSIVDDLKERWDDKIAKVQFRSFPMEDDRIFVMLADRLEYPIKIEIEEDQQRWKEYLDNCLLF